MSEQCKHKYMSKELRLQALVRLDKGESVQGFERGNSTVNVWRRNGKTIEGF